MQYVVAFCSLLEADSDVISGIFVAPIVSDKLVKFSDPCLKRSRHSRDGISDSFAIISDRNVM